MYSANDKSLSNLTKTRTANIISRKSKRKIDRAVSYITCTTPTKPYYNHKRKEVVKSYLSFITLTLSSKQIHTDTFIKRNILNYFLTILRRNYNVSKYIWRAERQTNQNIHFHILIDRYIYWANLRAEWNRCQELYGYITRYGNEQKEYHKDGFKVRKELLKQWDVKQQYKAYLKGSSNNWNNPNSTDIHSLRSIKDVRSYICKYVTKPDEESIIKGQLWNASENLRELKGEREFFNGHLNEEFGELMKHPTTRVFQSDYFTVLNFKFGTITDKRFSGIFASCLTYLRKRNLICDNSVPLILSDYG